MLPTVIDPEGTVKANDSVVFFNFRPDRAREITRAFVDPDFTGFTRKHGFFPLTYVCMTQYDATMPNVLVAYPPESLHMTMGEYLSKCGKTQLRIAETQKYAHVTFFFNGGEERTFPGEDRILVPSPSAEEVPTFDLKPEMSAYEVTDAVLPCINEDKYDVIILNFANCDMVGHTGVMAAAMKAVKTVDECVGEDRGRDRRARRQVHHHRRSWQRRSDDRPRSRRPVHRAHHEPGAGDRRRSGASASSRCAMAVACATSARRCWT